MTICVCVCVCMCVYVSVALYGQKVENQATLFVQSEERNNEMKIK